MNLYAHPFSSYCQKVLIALYENNTPFDWRLIEDAAPEVVAEHAALWPLKRFPVLQDGDRVIAESSIIIEYLDQQHPGPVRLIPSAPDAALEVRFLDRFFDNYIAGPLLTVVFDSLRPAEHRDPYGVENAHAQFETAYRWLDQTLAGRQWAAGDTFSLADCAAAPALFYADWVHPIDERFGQVRAYRSRLLDRQSFARAVDEARPYRHLFPLGAPDRD